MANLSENDLRLFVDSFKNFLRVTTRQEPQITSPFLVTGDVQGFEFKRFVTFSGAYNGQVIVSMPARLLRELLLLKNETNLSDGNLLDEAGEIANTLAGDARKTLGPGLEISVPIKVQGAPKVKSKVRKHPFMITLQWGHHEAMVCVDIERRH